MASSDSIGTPSIDLKLEVVTLPVSDVDRAKHFYQGLGWRLDADFGVGRRLPDSAVHPAPLTVLDPLRQGADDGRARVRETAVARSRGHRIGPCRADRPRRRRQRGVPLRPTARTPGGRRRESRGPTPTRATRTSNYASFSDPDGNGWLLQEITTRLPGREWDDSTDIAALPTCCTKPPSTMVSSKRSPRRTTGGTGTRPTSPLASGGAPRRRPPGPLTSTWPMSSTLSSRPARGRDATRNRGRYR